MTNWLEDVYQLIQLDKSDEAIDLLFEEIDTLLSDGKFAECDELIKGINISRLDLNLCVALLTITGSARNELTYREKMVECVSKRVKELAPDRYEGLMVGLR